MCLWACLYSHCSCPVHHQMCRSPGGQRPDFLPWLALLQYCSLGPEIHCHTAGGGGGGGDEWGEGGEGRNLNKFLPPDEEGLDFVLASLSLSLSLTHTHIHTHTPQPELQHQSVINNRYKVRVLGTVQGAEVWRVCFTKETLSSSSPPPPPPPPLVLPIQLQNEPVPYYICKVTQI